MSLIRLTIVIFFLLAACPVLAGETVRIANGEWLPLYSKDLPHYGPVPRIVTEAFALGGVEVEYVFMPWQRGYQEMQDGRLDASMGWSRTDERKKRALFSDTLYYSSPMIFFHRTDMAFDWQTMADLKGLRVICNIGYTYGDDLEQAIDQGVVTKVEVVDEKQGFKLLIKGRADVYPNHLYTSNILRTNFSKEEVAQITHHDRPLELATSCVVFTKTERGARLRSIFNHGLRKLYEAGKVQEYLKPYPECKLAE